ncbi:MAG: hypothetical protein JW820_05630 [Spirochaetales bacterium]|nr:hypothetical protein [Spirochaetales bacterium]
MSGLYQRALAYIRTQSEAVQPGEPSVESAGDLPVGLPQRISEGDREKVLGQINQIVAQNRIQVTPEALSFTPKHRGGRLPFLINAAAAVVLIAGIATAVFLFRQQEEAIVTAPTGVETAEGRLIRALREESERELSQKQREIDEIQARLRSITEEKAELQAQTDARLRERERELRDALSRELEAERERLRNAGLSDTRITAELQELESERSRSLQDELADYRGQVEAVLREREADLDDVLAEYQRNLQVAQEESTRLQQDLAAREAELEARFRAQENALQEDRARALEELEGLRQQQEKEQLIRDQFLSFYSAARDHLAERRFPEALAVLQEFRNYLDQPSMSALPGIRRRRPVEQFLIDSLERLIGQEQRSAQADTTSLIASAELIARVSEMVERADRPFQDGDFEQARELYLGALAEIPAVQLGYERLRAIETSFERRNREEIAALITAAGSAYRRGDYQGAVGGYRRALTLLHGEREAAEAMIARITDSGFRLRSAEQPPGAEGGASLAELQAARDRIAELEAARAAAQQRIAELEAAARAAGGQTAQLAEAQRRLSELEAARAAAEGRVAELETARTAAQQRIAELEAARAGAQERIAALEASRNTTQGRLDELQRLRRETEERAARMEQIRGQYLALSSPGTAAGVSRSALITLLETKVLIQRVLISEPVRSQYPELYDRFEKYLVALVEEEERATQVEVLQDVEMLLDELLREEGRATLPETLEPYRFAPASEPFLRVLEKLELLLR